MFDGVSPYHTVSHAEKRYFTTSYESVLILTILHHIVKVSSRWVKHLYGLVDELNDTETEMIGMKPKDAIVLDQVPLAKRENYPPEEVLPEDGLLLIPIATW